MATYDSTEDTLIHINRVDALLHRFAHELIARGKFHDASKLEAPEKPYWDQAIPKFQTVEFGSAAYRAICDEVRPAIEHHNRMNRHHPEHWDDGISGMDLVDLVEMFLDWKAASDRSGGGNFVSSIGLCNRRYEMSDELLSIFLNTAARLDWL